MGSRHLAFLLLVRGEYRRDGGRGMSLGISSITLLESRAGKRIT